MKVLAFLVLAVFCVAGLLRVVSHGSGSNPGSGYKVVGPSDDWHPSATPAAQSRPPASQPTTQPEDKEARAFLAEVQKKGAFGDITFQGREIDVVVLPKWYGCDFKTKSAFTGVVLKWGQSVNPEARAIYFFDYKTNKIVASYTPVGGFEMK